MATKDMKTDRYEEPALESYLREIRKYPLLSASEEESLARSARAGHEEARHVLVNRNLRLVVNIAKRYAEMGLPLIDLVAEGNLGLLHAVDRFDPDHGCRFSTYATYWIKHAICRALTDKNQVIRIPSYMRKILARTKEIARSLAQAGIEPTPREILRRLPLPKKTHRAVEDAIQVSHFIDTTRSLEAMNEKSDTIEDRRVRQDSERVDDLLEVERLGRALDELDPRKVAILQMRFGIGPFTEPMTLREIGERVNLTKERVRQIEKETIEKLRDLLEPIAA